MYVIFLLDKILFFLMENFIFNYQMVEKEEVVVEIVFGMFFLQSDVNIMWYRNDLKVRNLFCVEIIMDVVDDYFRFYIIRFMIKFVREFYNGVVIFILYIVNWVLLF